MVKEAKDVLENTLRSRLPDVFTSEKKNIVRKAADEGRAIMSRNFPFAAIITKPGDFDNRTAKVIRYVDEETGEYNERDIHGDRKLPLTLRVWGGESEDAVDELFSAILPEISRRWELDGLEGFITIQSEEHSDFADSATTLYVSVAEILFTMPIVSGAVRVPTINVGQTSLEQEVDAASL